MSLSLASLSLVLLLSDQANAAAPPAKPNTPTSSETSASAAPSTSKSEQEPAAKKEKAIEVQLRPTDDPDFVPSKTTVIKNKSVPPFWIDRETPYFRVRALSLPPIYLHRTPKADSPESLLHMDLALTFGWYDKERGKRRWMSIPGLYFGAYGKHTSAWGAAPLLMGYKRVGEKFNFGQFPFVWWWGNKQVKNLFVFPLHFHQKTPDSFQGVSGLVAWYGGRNLEDKDPLNDRRHRVLFPLFFRFQKGHRRWTMAPLYAGGHNKDKGTKFRSVLPLFHYRKLEFGNRQELWTALWIKRTDKARQNNSWAIPPLMTFAHHTQERSLLSVTPLVWHKTDRIESGESLIVGPYGFHRDLRQSNQWVAPLWWNFHDKESDTRSQFLFPFYHRRKGTQHSRLDTPLFSTATRSIEHKGQLQQEKRFGIHPLFSYSLRGPTHSRDLILGGLFWRSNKQSEEYQSRGWGLGPLVYRTQSFSNDANPSATKSSFGIPPLLLFSHKTPEKTIQTFTPLLWHKRTPEFGDTWVAGPAYFGRGPNKQGWRSGVLPLYLASSDENQSKLILPPLLFGEIVDKKSGEKITWSPLFVHTRGPGYRTVGVGGLAWDVQRPGERHSVFAPIYYRRQKTTPLGIEKLTLTPIGASWSTPDRTLAVLGPYYRHKNAEKRDFGLVPFVFHQSRPGPGSENDGWDSPGQTTVIPPLFFIRDRRPSRDLDVWTPLLWRSRTGGLKPRRNLAVVPFYFRQRQEKGVDIDAGLPWFYSRDHYRRTHTLIAGPFFHRLTREKLHTGLAPISWWMDSEEKRHLYVLPLLFHKENKQAQEATTVAFPLWFSRKYPGHRHSWMAFPFVIGRDFKTQHTRVGIGAPGYIDIFRLSKNSRFTGALPFLFRYQKCGFVKGDEDSCRYTLWGSIPLFLYGKDGQGRRSHSALSLYWYDRSPTSYKFYTWLGGYHRKQNERLKWYAGPLYYDWTTTHKTAAFFPLYFRRENRNAAKGEQQSTTLIVPPVYIGQQKEDRSWSETALLFWQFRQVHKRTTVVPPVFGYHHSDQERRLHWLLPFYIRDNKMGHDKDWTTVFPLLYVQNRRGDKQDVVQFPLLWHFKRGEKQTTIGGFLWYDIRRAKHSTQVLPGLYFAREQGGKTTRVVGPGLGWWSELERESAEESEAGIERPAQTHWRALFGLFGGGYDETGRRYFSLFGARIKLRQKSIAASSEAAQTSDEAKSSGN